MNKNKVGYWIKRKGNEKFEDTKPEQFVSGILDRLGIPYGDHISHWIDGYTITGDFELMNPPKVLIEVDGDYHRTEKQESKTRWRDGEVNSRGFHIIHIDSRLCVPKWEKYLSAALQQAIRNGNPVERIYA